MSSYFINPYAVKGDKTGSAGCNGVGKIMSICATIGDTSFIVGKACALGKSGHSL